MFRRIRLLPLLAVAVTALALAGTASARSLYVTGERGSILAGEPGFVSVLDTANDTFAPAPIPAGVLPLGVAITPDGTRAYVTSSGLSEGSTFDTTVSVIDTSTNLTIGGPIRVGNGPVGIAITPDGSRAYVVAIYAGVSVIDTNPSSPTYNMVTKTIGGLPGGAFGIAITPDGSRAYVAAVNANNVVVIDTNPSSPTYNTVVGAPIAVGSQPFGPGITPDGRKLYVPNSNSDSVSVIDTDPSSLTYNTVVGAPISSGIVNPFMVAVSPDGSRAYVTSGGELFSPCPCPDTVAVIDTSTDATTGSPITTGANPGGVAFTPDGSHAYVANAAAGTISDINTGNASTATITFPGGPLLAAMTPAQGAVADFTANAGGSGSPTSFSATLAENLNGSEGRYDWDFGDGTSAANAGRTQSHTFSSPGTYNVTLTVTADIGSFAGGVFTGQTASVRQGASTTATKTAQVSVGDVTGPAVKVKSPRKNQKINRRKFRRVRGTATDSSGVTKVTYSIFRKSKVRKSRHTRKTTTLCRYLKRNNQLTGFRSCNRLNYLTAKGTTSWSVRIKRASRLPRGKYTLYVKATDTAGNTSSPTKVAFRLV